MKNKQTYAIIQKRQSMKLLPQVKTYNEDLKDVATERIQRGTENKNGGSEENQKEMKILAQEIIVGCSEVNSQIVTQRTEYEFSIDQKEQVIDSNIFYQKPRIEEINLDETQKDQDSILHDQEPNTKTDHIQNQQTESQKIETEFVDKNNPKQLQQQMSSPIHSTKPYLYYVYGGNYPETVAKALIARGNWQVGREEDNIEKCNFVWRPFNYPPEGYKRIDKRTVRNNQTFIYNHFEVLKGLTTKSGLVRSLKQYYFNNELARQGGYSIFDSTPTTFLLASGIEDAEWTEFIQRYKDIQKGWAPKERIPIKHCVNNIWLVKPSNANQGKGIEIFSDLDELITFVNSRPQFTCCVVQKYIERPLLFKGRKFDIRVWALFNHKNEVYMYKHGYLRTSSDDYNLQNGNNYVHLTNNCLQKYGDNYGVHEEGNTVGFHVLQEFLDTNFPQYKLNVYEHFVPRMRDLIIDTFNATKHQLNPNRRKPCFELLGYDFLIDEDFRLWLIEVNTNPYFGVPNNFIAKLLPKMMDDLLEIVVDPFYPPMNKPENLNCPNDFELLYCDTGSSQNQNPVNLRRPFNISLYPVQELAQMVGPKVPRQDMKYLRQFKISNFQISTLSHKKAKASPKAEVNDDHRQTTKSAAKIKANARSSSLIARNRASSSSHKNHHHTNQTAIVDKEKASTSNHVSQQHANTISTMTNSTAITNQQLFSRANRSKSSYQVRNKKTSAIMMNSQNHQSLQQTMMQNSEIKERSKSQRSHNRNGDQARKSLHLRETATSSFKRNPMIFSKTPKQEQPMKSLMNSNQISTPRGNQLQCQIGFNKRENSRSDTANRYLKNGCITAACNTTKETSSIEYQSNSSSQDKFFFKKFNRESSIEKRDYNPSNCDFEKNLSQIVEQIMLNSEDKTKIQLTQLKKIMEQPNISINEFVIATLMKPLSYEGLQEQTTSCLIEILVKVSEKLQAKQILSKNKNIETLLILINKHQDLRIKANLLKILANVSSYEDLSKLKSVNNMSSLDQQTANKDCEGIIIVKQQLLKRSISNGVLSLILAELNDQVRKSILAILNTKELEQILQQLSLPAWSVNQSPTNQSYSNRDLNIDNKLIDVSGSPSRTMNTDPDQVEEFQIKNQKLYKFLDSNQDIKKETSSSEFHAKQSFPLIGSPLSKQSKSKRQERLQEKEKRSQQDSQNQTPRLGSSKSRDNQVLKLVQQLIGDENRTQVIEKLQMRVQQMKIQQINQLKVLDQDSVQKDASNLKKNRREESIERLGSNYNKDNCSPFQKYLQKQQFQVSPKVNKNLYENKSHAIQTPEKILNQKVARESSLTRQSINSKETPPKKQCFASRPSSNLMNNFIQSNIKQKYSNSKQANVTEGKIPFSVLNTSGVPFAKDEELKGKSKFQPILKSKTHNNSSNQNQRQESKLSSLSSSTLKQQQTSMVNSASKKSYIEMNQKKLRAQSRGSLCNSNSKADLQQRKLQQISQKKLNQKQSISKNNVQTTNDKILSSINQKINDIQTNLNILSAHAVKRKLSKSIVNSSNPFINQNSNYEKINLHTFVSNESNDSNVFLRMAEPQELKLDYALNSGAGTITNGQFSSSEVNFVTGEGNPHKLTMDLEVRRSSQNDYMILKQEAMTSSPNFYYNLAKGGAASASLLSIKRKNSVGEVSKGGKINNSAVGCVSNVCSSGQSSQTPKKMINQNQQTNQMPTRDLFKKDASKSKKNQLFVIK